MAKKKRNTKLKKQIKDTFILTIIICAIIFAIYKIIGLISSPTDTFVLKKSTISSEESKVGYVIREEHIVQGTEEGKNIEPIKNEGERVSAKQPIFKYYNVNDKEITKQIEELNKKIQEALLGQKDLFPSDVKSIEGQIEKQLEKLRNKNNMQYILECKNNISDYVVKKAKIAGSLSSAGVYINNLIKERNTLEETLTNGAEYVYSNISGVVSYRIDGLEETLKVDELDKLTVKGLKDLNLTTGQIVSKNPNEAKVINNFECYIAVGFNKEILDSIQLGQKATLRLASQEEIKAEVYKINEDGNQILVIFKINDGVENLINYRKISLDVIWWSYTGLMTSKSSILYENGLSYVLRKKNGNTEKILVKILKENDNYCIIGNYDSEELVNLGYTTKEINSIKTIKLYDEIIVNPEME